MSAMIYQNLFFEQKMIQSQTPKKKYKAFSGSLQVHIIKDITIHSSTAPKWNFKLITCINIEKWFDLLVAVLFAMRPKLGGIWTKYKDFVL